MLTPHLPDLCGQACSPKTVWQLLQLLAWSQGSVYNALSFIAVAQSKDESLWVTVQFCTLLHVQQPIYCSVCAAF